MVKRGGIPFDCGINQRPSGLVGRGQAEARCTCHENGQGKHCDGCFGADTHRHARLWVDGPAVTGPAHLNVALRVTPIAVLKIRIVAVLNNVRQ